MSVPGIYSVVSGNAMSRAFGMLERVLDDAEYANGVVSARVSGGGMYVINRQPPKEEIWMSSPVSGPSHYRYVNDQWVSSTGKSLFNVLESELADVQKISSDNEGIE